MKFKTVQPHAIPAVASGALALGTLALGALALGALAVGAVAIGRLAVGNARIRRLEIDELVVRRLRVEEQMTMPPESVGPTPGVGEGGLLMITGACLCGSVRWQFDAQPDGATACNCTACRRYGVLWAYDHEGEGIRVSGLTRAYARGKALEFHFCPTCGCVAFWRGLQTDAQGRRRIAVNLRLAEPDAVARIPIDHFDGLDTFDDLPRDGRCVADYWF